MGLTPRARRTVFRNAYAGKTVYVLASGASLDHVDPRFFADKFTVAVNFIGHELGIRPTFVATHYHIDAIAIAAQHPEQVVIVPEHDQGGTNLAPHAPTAETVWSFPTNQQMYAGFSVDEHWPTEPDSLVVGPTSLHFAMHFAAYLVGPSGFVVLVGADCGTLDDRANRDGHDKGMGWPWDVWAESLPHVANKIRASGTGVMSLNPFVNPGLEGHRYWSSTTTIN